MTTLICGITPDAWTWRRKIPPYPCRAEAPSWMRAPPLSLSPMRGAPAASAMSITLWIFSACAVPSDPPRIVKSWA